MTQNHIQIKYQWLANVFIPFILLVEYKRNNSRPVTKQQKNFKSIWPIFFHCAKWNNPHILPKSVSREPERKKNEEKSNNLHDAKTNPLKASFIAIIAIKKKQSYEKAFLESIECQWIRTMRKLCCELQLVQLLWRCWEKEKKKTMCTQFKNAFYLLYKKKMLRKQNWAVIIEKKKILGVKKK